MNPFPALFIGPATPPVHQLHRLDQHEVFVAFMASRRIGRMVGELMLRQLRERQVLSDLTSDSFSSPLRPRFVDRTGR